jgi:ubiquinone/menaquinone biosynthesis C-methylase UbiE
MLDELETAVALPRVRGRDLLEVGCGTGLVLQRLAPHARRAVGVDLSEGMLRRAAARGLRVVQGDAVRLPFRDATFDVVVSFKVLAHVERIDDALAEMARVVRPGGHLVLEFYNARSIRHLVKTLGPAGRVAKNAKEDAVFTRFDTLKGLRARVRPPLRYVGHAGIRVFTPAAGFHKIPLLGGALRAAERAALRSPLARFGGFLVLELARD